MKNRNTISLRYRIIPLALALLSLLCSCTDTFSEKEITTGGGYENFKGNTITVTARVSSGSSRYAMPTIPELVYAALLYPDNKRPENPPSEKFVEGVPNESDDKLIFSFQRPDETDGITFTLEVFAFVKADAVAEDGTTTFSRTGALLSGCEHGLMIDDDSDEIKVANPIALSSSEPGTVNLKIKVPDGCSLEIDEKTMDGEIVSAENAHFIITGTSPNFIITQKDASEIPAGAYQVTFTTKKGGEIVNVFSEYINVINRLCTDTWSGLGRGEAKDVTNSISKTVYVRGAGGWYDTTYNDDTTAKADDDNLGSFSSPLATIQKAVDTVIARNDGTSDDKTFTIYIDGTLTATSSDALANFNSGSQPLSVRIVGLDASNKSILNGNGTARVVSVRNTGNKDLNLTLENLVITDGYYAGNGGGIYFYGKTLEMTGCEVIGCEATRGGGVYVDSGSFTMNGGTISDNTASNTGGAMYINSAAEVSMTDVEIKENKAALAGGAYVYGGTLEMKNCKVENNTATSYNAGGIRVYDGGTVIMDGGTISGNRVEGSSSDKNHGGGVYISGSSSKFTMTGAAAISGNILSDTASSRYGSGVFVDSGTFEMEGGTISGGSATYGGGVYIYNGEFTMSGGTISGNNDSSLGGGIYVCNGTFTIKNNATVSSNTALNGGGVYVYNGTFTMSGGELTGNIASSSFGGGVYISQDGTFTMEKGSISGCKAIGGGGIYNSGKLTVESGTKISGCMGNSWGGGIYNAGTSAVAEISGCTIESCNTTSASSNVGGGGINNSTGTLTVSDCTFTLCTTAASGGGIRNTGELTVSNTSFTNCSADKKGGGICNVDGTVTSTNITYSGCTAPTDNDGSGF